MKSEHDQMTKQDEVYQTAMTIQKPRTIEWISEQSGVSWETANKYVTTLKQLGVLIETDDGKYDVNRLRRHEESIRNVVFGLTEQEIREKIEESEEKVEKIKSEYNVESKRELRSKVVEEKISEETQKDISKANSKWDSLSSKLMILREAYERYEQIRDRANDYGQERDLEQNYDSDDKKTFVR